MSEKQLFLGDFFEDLLGKAGGTVVVRSIRSVLIGLDMGLGTFIGGSGLGIDSVVLLRLLTPLGGKGGACRVTPLLE